MSKHYDHDYFDWQAPIGAFGGWADQTKFSDYVSPEDTVLDFGCGGGYLLNAMSCKKRIGIEPNSAAAEKAISKGIETYRCVADVPDDHVDVIVSDNALEHTLQPLDELKALRTKLKIGGKAIFVVPCESIRLSYRPDDTNHHLYSWSPMCLGNILTEAGYSVIESKPYIHKWPPKYNLVAKVFSRRLCNRSVCGGWIG